MATDAEQIALIKSQAYANLVAITASPKPSYSIGDHTVSWTKYKESLRADIAWADAQLASIAPYEIHSQGFT
jgi:hypothetical protein